MKKILLVNPNTYSNPYPVFPLGLSYVEGALQEAGFDTQFFDLNLDKGDLLEKSLSAYQPDFIGISLRNVDDVQIGKREFFVDKIRELIIRIRLVSKSRIVLGGSGFSILPREIYELCEPDFGIAGEGEHVFTMLINEVNYKSIPGLVYRSEKGIVVNQVRLLGKGDFNAPKRRSRILDYFLQDGGMVNIQTQRGCPLRCCYCTYPVIEGRQYRRRSGQSIAEEMLDLKKRGAKYVFFVDSVFNTSQAHVRQICEALIEVGSPLSWGCFIRPKGLSVELVSLMQKAGLTHIEFGSDSLNTEILKHYGKGFTFEDIVESSNIVREVGVYFCHFLIFGGPGETEASMDVSFENSNKIPEALFFPTIGMRVYPQTHLQKVSETVPGIESTPSLLQPTYFLASGLDQALLERKILEYSKLSPAWVDVQHSTEFDALAKRLRERGVVGPLWNYLTVLRRLSPSGA